MSAPTDRPWWDGSAELEAVRKKDEEDFAAEQRARWFGRQVAGGFARGLGWTLARDLVRAMFGGRR